MRGMFEMNRKIALVGIRNCYLSEITVAELYYGAENSDNPQKTMRQTEEFISLFHVIPFGKSLHTGEVNKWLDIRKHPYWRTDWLGNRPRNELCQQACTNPLLHQC